MTGKRALARTNPTSWLEFRGKVLIDSHPARRKVERGQLLHTTPGVKSISERGHMFVEAGPLSRVKKANLICFQAKKHFIILNIYVKYFASNACLYDITSY